MKTELLNNPSTPLRDGTSTPLRTGYTTGACAAAAAKGATLMLTHQTTVREVSITLPGGGIATFFLHGQLYSTDEARCYVVKDAGDDPDVTNGAEVHAAVRREHESPEGDVSIIISGGEGIGKITKPGLAIPPGEWAINPVPRRMIEEAVRTASNLQSSAFSLHITISIPDGEERAKKTLNTRLGIIGGLSILGTTGIVRPISAKAWTDTIDAALDVAKACNCETTVLSTGRTSELAAQNFLKRTEAGERHSANLFETPQSFASCPIAPPTRTINLPEEAYVMMGDHITYALQACQSRGFNQPIIACQFAKLLKIACGHENTHAAASELDLARLLEWAQDSNLPQSILESISNANTAREIAITCSFDPAMLELVFQHARQAVKKHSPAVSPQFLVADYNGNCIFNSR